VIRDIFLNRTALIFKKEIYAMASIAGGLVYWLMLVASFNMGVAATVTFFFICLIRFLAMKYHISLPTLRGEEDGEE